MMKRCLLWLLPRLARLLRKREIQGEHGVILERYSLWGWMPGDPDSPQPFHLYLHHFLLPDPDPALHNHPWEWAASLILTGGYWEDRSEQWDDLFPLIRFCDAGTVNRFDKFVFHRVEDLRGDCWTLILTGRKTQSWGFKVFGPEGPKFVPWRNRLRARGLEPQY